jgi:hypothetical protein
MDTFRLETSSAKLDSDREHGRRYCRMHILVLHVADVRGVAARVSQPGGGQVDYAQQRQSLL